MDIKFFGAAKEVTGSNYLISTKTHKILIDCGLFQGSSEIEEKNFEDFPYNVREIDYLILTHAHIDHSGRIPKLVNDGFRGDILCTKPTYDLCEIMLLDSGKIHESDAKWENRKRQRRGEKEIKPLYTVDDAENSLRYFKSYYYNQFINIDENIQIRFKDAGHILGSAIIEIWIEEDNERTKLVFSGDLGMAGRPILKEPEFVESADYLIMESTYGDENHEEFKTSTKRLIDIINKTALRGGSVIIPSFAVGRTQELIYELNKYYQYSDVEEYMKIPIYIDSPMAVNATEAFQKNSNSFNEEAQNLILQGDNPFKFPNLRYIKSQEESMALNKSDYPKVIISASGMATAGRIRHHLKHNLWNPKNSLVFVGYQAQGTLGRILLDGVKNVKLLGERVNVALEIYDLQGFSAHADQNALINWIDNFKHKPEKIFLVHGEEKPTSTLAQIIESKFKINTIIPEIGDEFNISRRHVELKSTSKAEPKILKEDLEEELNSIYKQFEALVGRKDEIYLDKDIEKNYSEIKNKLIDLQNYLMDMKILLNKN